MSSIVIRYCNDRSEVLQKLNGGFLKVLQEWGTDQYVNEIVDHKEARELCLKTYKEALDNR